MRASPAQGVLVALYLSASALAHNHGHHHQARQGPAYPSGPGYDVPAPATTTVAFDKLPPEPTVALPPLLPGAGLYPGAPPMPAINIVPSQWPELDKTPPTNSPEVQQWLKEIEGVNIPNYSVTSGDCETSPTIVPDAGPDKRCWWTCGGCTRSTDVTTCNKKGHWGLTFDDGPTETTPKLLTYLNSKNLKASFYMVGSRVISHPEMAQYQHLSGHELAVHTWSHASLTMLTNEQIVAELGWTRKAIKDVTGVTPLSMRPPRGDIDDRVRAISLAMGMTPILWTGVDPNAFDTNDWRVSAGQMTAAESAGNFSRILDTANSLTTGFIVLEHDNHAQPVNLAIGTTLPLGQSKGFTLEPVYTCLDRPLSDSYAETVKNPAIATPKGTGGTTTGTGTSSTPKPTGAATGLDAPLFAGVFAAIAAMLF